MPNPAQPSEEAQKPDLPVPETPKVVEATLPESPKPAEGVTPGAVPEGGKQPDLENKLKTLEGLLKATQRERDTDKKTIQSLADRLEATEKDLGESLEALTKQPTPEPLQDEKPGERPMSAITGILDRRRQRDAEAKTKAATGQVSATVRFVALVEGAGLDLNDSRLADAKTAPTPEDGIEVAKKIIKEIRENERKATDDRFNQLAGQVKELKEGMLKVDTSGPSGGVIPQGSPYDLAIAAYSSSNKTKR